MTKIQKNAISRYLDSVGEKELLEFIFDNGDEREIERFLESLIDKEEWLNTDFLEGYFEFKDDRHLSEQLEDLDEREISELAYRLNSETASILVEQILNYHPGIKDNL